MLIKHLMSAGHICFISMFRTPIKYNTMAADKRFDKKIHSNQYGTTKENDPKERTKDLPKRPNLQNGNQKKEEE